MEQLLTMGLISVNDSIHFMFKRNKITGRIGHGGHILHTIISTPLEENKTLFTHTYPSLTAWSEACLREGLQEENTRYASWKRIIHQKSGRTLQNLRSQLNANTKMSAASRQDLYSEINRLQLMVMQQQRVPIIERKDASTTDALLMTPEVIACFKRWAATSLHTG